MRTKANNKELVWIAVVNERLECVYESLVKPRAAVVDYLTELVLSFVEFHVKSFNFFTDPSA